jgi:hypothetical protein
VTARKASAKPVRRCPATPYTEAAWLICRAEAALLASSDPRDAEFQRDIEAVLKKHLPF